MKSYPVFEHFVAIFRNFRGNLASETASLALRWRSDVTPRSNEVTFVAGVDVLRPVGK